jgi:DNA-binding NtrC family response regulator
MAKKVLILEDDLTFKLLWDQILQKVGPVETFWAASTPDAEGLLMRESFDLIISDIFLKGKDNGLEFWEKHEPMLRYKTILVSSVEQDRLDRYLGNRDYYPFYVRKPLDVAHCTDTVRWIFKKQSGERWKRPGSLHP